MKKSMRILSVVLTSALLLVSAGCKHNNNLDEPDSRILDFRLKKTSRYARAVTDKNITKADAPIEILHGEPCTDEEVSNLFVFEKDAAGVKVTVKPLPAMINTDDGLYDISVRWIDNTGHWNVGQWLSKDIIKKFNNHEITEYTWIYPITNEGVTYKFVANISYDNPNERDGYYTQAIYEITAGGGVGCPSDLPQEFTDEGYVVVDHDVLKVIDVIPVEIGTVEKIWRSGIIYEQTEEGKFSWDDNYWVTEGLIEGTTENDLLEMNFNDSMSFQYADWGGDIMTSAPYISVQFQYIYTLPGYDYCVFKTPDLHSDNDENTYFSQPVSKRLDMVRLYPLDPDFEITVVQDDDGVKFAGPDVGSGKKYESVKLTNGVDSGNRDFYYKENGYVYPFVVPGTTYRFTGLLRDKEGTVVARTNSVEITPKNGHGSVMVDADYTLYKPTMKTFPGVAQLNQGATGKAIAGNISGKDAKVGYWITMHQSDSADSKSYWNDWLYNFYSDDYTNIPLRETNVYDDITRLDYYNLTMEVGEFCYLKDGTPKFEKTTGEYIHKQNWVAMPLIGQTKTATIGEDVYKITFDYGRKCTVSVNGGAAQAATWTRTTKDCPVKTAELITLKFGSETVEVYYDYVTDKFSKNILLDTLSVDDNVVLDYSNTPDGLKFEIKKANGTSCKFGDNETYNRFWLFNNLDNAKVEVWGNTLAEYPCVIPGTEYEFTAVLITPNNTQLRTKAVKVTPTAGHGSITFNKHQGEITARFTDDGQNGIVELTGEITGVEKSVSNMEIGYKVFSSLTNDTSYTGYWGGRNPRPGAFTTKTSNINLHENNDQQFQKFMYKHYKYMNFVVDLGVVYTDTNGNKQFLKVVDNPSSTYNIWHENPMYDASADSVIGTWRQVYCGSYVREYVIEEGRFTYNVYPTGIDNGKDDSQTLTGTYTMDDTKITCTYDLYGVSDEVPYTFSEYDGLLKLMLKLTPGSNELTDLYFSKYFD